jgi:hypothetical protein
MDTPPLFLLLSIKGDVKTGNPAGAINILDNAECKNVDYFSELCYISEKPHREYTHEDCHM